MARRKDGAAPSGEGDGGEARGTAGEVGRPAEREDADGPAGRDDEVRRRVTSALLEVAREVLAAESPAEVVELVEGMDARVEELARILEGA